MVSTRPKETGWGRKVMQLPSRKGKLGPQGERAFFAPQRHCRTSVTLSDMKGEKNKTLEEPLNCTQPGLEVSPPLQRRKTSSPKAALSLALPPLLPSSFWQLGWVPVEAKQTPERPEKSLWRAKVGRTLLKIQIHLIWKEPGQFWAHEPAQIFPTFSPAQGLGS